MKQLLIKRGRIAVENIPAPLIQPGHVLVEVAYSLISTGTEVEGVKRSAEPLIQKALKQPDQLRKLINILQERGIKHTLDMIKDKISSGIPLGYSCSGIVVQVGEGVDHIKPGDRVACAGAGKASHAEIVLVPKNLVVKIPENCNLQDAASVALGSIALQGTRRADPKIGEVIAVIGLGLLGQLTVQILKAVGCRVIGFDLLKNRVELAKQFGMNWGFVSSEVNIQKEISHITENRGVDTTIITAAAPKDNSIIQLASEITRKKGKIIIVGDVGLAIRRSPFYEKELDILISASYGPGRYDEAYEEKGIDYPYAYVRWTEKRNMEEYLNLLAENKVNFGCLVKKLYPIDKAEEAYKSLQQEEPRPLAVLLDYCINEENIDKKLRNKIEILKFPKAKTGIIKVAVVGAGNFARSAHLPNLRRLSNLYSIHAIVSANGIHAEETAKRFGASYSTTDFHAVLHDDEIDMVLICTRHNMHAKMAIEAAKAGKAVFLEKPMAINQEELEELIDVIEKTKVPFAVGFNRRFSPAASKAKDLVKYRINPMVIVYRVNAGYIPLDHWIQGEEGAGRIIGEACHMFDLFNYFTEAAIETIDASSISPKTEHVSPRDNFIANIKYSDGSLCSLVYSSLGSSDVPKEYIEIHFDSKTLIINDFKELMIYGMKKDGWKGVQNKGHFDELNKFGKYLLEKEGDFIPLNELATATMVSFIVDELVKK